MEERNIRVFISYCQESIEHSDMVLSFSNKLRSEGIDALIDQYIEVPEEGWPRWMENSIQEADFILLICTNEYLKRITGKVGKGTGKGVKWEGNLIYQYFYNEDTLNKKFIPIIFNEKDREFIPMPLQGTTYYDVSKPSRYDDLYWRIRGINKKQMPELGKLRPLPTKERKSLYIATPIDLESWDKAVWRGAAFLMDPTNQNAPCFLLPFKNEFYAKKIFSDWISLYGNIDKFEELRISIVEGDIPGEDKGYTIHISSNIDRVIMRMEEMNLDFDENLIMSISRMQRANPTDNFRMLNLFKSQYKQHKEYILMPAVLDETHNRIKPLMELGIKKREIVFRHVSEIKDNDEDAAVISKNKPWEKYNKS